MPKPLWSPGRLVAGRADLEAKARSAVQRVFMAHRRKRIASASAFAKDVATALAGVGVGDEHVIEMDLIQSHLLDRMELETTQGDNFRLDDWREQFEDAANNLAATQYQSEVTEELAEEGYTHRRWVAIADDRTRPTHRAASGQVVTLDEPFTVGGYPLRYPHDPDGPASETVNCRCSQVGVRGEDSEGDTPEQFSDNIQQDIDPETREGSVIESFLASDGVDLLVNRVLRHPSRRWGTKSLEAARSSKAAMDSAFRNHGTVMATTRRFTRRAPSVPKAGEGGVISDPGYLSVQAVSAGSGVTTGSGWTIDVVAPAGTKILRGSKAAHEIILPRGLKYRVVKRDNANRYLKLRIMS